MAIILDGTNGITTPDLETSGSSSISVNTSTDAFRITQTGTGNALVVEDSANPDSTPFVVNASGQLVIGRTTGVSSISPLQIISDGSSTLGSGINLYRMSSDTGGTAFNSLKARGDKTTPTIVNAGDTLLSIGAFGYDGSTYIPAASIQAFVDSTPGANDMPGVLLFNTTADGASSTTERMRIDNAGRIGIGNTPSAGQRFVIGGIQTLGASPIYLLNQQTIQSDATGNPAYFYSYLNSQPGSYTVTGVYHFRADAAVLGAGSAITSQYAFFAGGGLIGATNNYGFYSNIASGTGRWNFYAGGTADNYFAGRIGVGSSDLSTVNVRFGIPFSGGVTSYGLYTDSVAASTVTTNATAFQTYIGTQAASFTLNTLGHYVAGQQPLGAGSTVSNQYGFIAQASLIGATNNYGFYGNIASGTGRYNFYAAGTAANYFAGDVGIGQTSPTVPIHTYKNSTVQAVFEQTGGTQGFIVLRNTGSTGNDIRVASDSTNLTMYTAGTERMRIDSVGNVLVGTTTAQTTLLDASGTGVTIGGATAPNIALWDTTNASYVTYLGQVDNTAYLTNTANGGLYIGTNNQTRMVVRPDGNISVGSTGSAQVTMYLQGTTVGTGTCYGFYTNQTVSTGAGAFRCFQSNPSTAAGLTLSNISHYYAAAGTYSTAPTTQYGFYSGSDLTGASTTNTAFAAVDTGGAAATTGKTNTGFYSNLSTASGGGTAWNFYAGGTAANYFAGNVGIGTSSPSAKLDIGSGNLNFSGAAQRITGDFSNATIANRVAFQTSTTNGNTIVGFIPNGTATQSRLNVFNNVDTTNYSVGSLLISSTEVRLVSDASGTGTSLPMTFYTGGSERMRIDSAGTVTLASGSGLSISATNVTSPAATDGNVFSGNYTPTQVSTNTNVASVTFGTLYYSRVGNVVTVFGLFAVTATAAATSTILRFSLPIASNFSSSRQLGGGGGGSSNVYGQPIALLADTTNKCVEVRWTPPNTTASNYNFSFSYMVV